MEFCPYCDQPVGDEEEWAALIDPSVTGGFLRAHLICLPPEQSSAANEVRIATESLSRPPRRCRDGEDVPEQGWVIQANSQVFRDGELVGQFVDLTGNGRRWAVKYEYLGEDKGYERR